MKMITCKRIILLFIWINLVSSELNSLCDNNLEINLSKTGLQRLRRKFLSNSLINSLNLQDNQIWSIDAEAFEDLPNLEYLNLAGNFLPYSKLTQDFPKLKTLVLDDALTVASPEDLEESLSLSEHCTPCLSKDKRKTQHFDVNLEIKGALPALEKLHLRNNKISMLSGLENTPNLTHLHLENNDISREFFSTFIPSTLTHLHLENNSIEYLNSSVINQLEVLMLGHNNIYRLCSGDSCHQHKHKFYENDPLLNLAGAKRLEELSIADNMLMEVDEDAFADLENLRYLNLSGNYLEVLPLDVFVNLTNLKSLVLSNNLLRDIPDVDDMENLENLLLNGNEVKVVTGASFMNLPKLKTLSFANNALSQVEPGAFDDLTSLSELDLSGNKLLTLPENWISGISLQRLLLDSNSFTEIENMSLRNISGIEYLSIAGNPMRNFSARALIKLPETLVINIKPPGSARDDGEICQCYNFHCGEGRFKSFEGSELTETRR